MPSPRWPVVSVSSSAASSARAHLLVPAPDGRSPGSSRPEPAASRLAPPAGPGPAGEADARAVLDALSGVFRELRLCERRGRAGGLLPPAQRWALRELAERPAASLAELAARTCTDPSSTSVVVRRLVSRGLVVRAAADGDRRRTVLRVTAAGRAAASRASADDVTSVMAQALALLGARRATAVSRGLRALARGLAHAARTPGDARHDAAGQVEAARAPVGRGAIASADAP